jgi:hypothetical protein
MEVKQMMVLKPSNLFEKCIIKSAATTLAKEETLVKTEDKMPNITLVPIEESKKEQDREEVQEEETAESGLNDILDNIEESDSEKNISENDPPGSQEKYNSVQSRIPAMKDGAKTEITERQGGGKGEPGVPPTPIEYPSLEEIESDLESLAEFDLNLETVPENETVQLKQRNDVYYEMYKQARQKARAAKKLALTSYLEAKRIKNAYMLDDILDSDSDSDSEFDENEGEPSS